MSNKVRVLLDLNVVLDVLTKRSPHYVNSARVWAYVESGRVVGYLAAHSITTLFYLLRRHLGLSYAKSALDDVLSVFKVAAVNQTVIKNAQALEWDDFEDAVQAAAAELVGVDYLITRNQADFNNSSISIVCPDDFLEF